MEREHGDLLAITPAAALPVLQEVARSKTPPTIRYTTSILTSANGKNMPADLSKFQMPQGADPAWYRFGGIKDWIDGENDCRTGYMYQPYVGHFDTDPPGGKGTLVTDQAGANRFAAIARKAGVICRLHCSGDHATDIGLNAYDKVIKSGVPKTIMRIEHFGMFQLTNAQLARAQEMRKQGLYLSVQPTWLLDLVKADFENMGEPRTRTGFQFRSMIDAGLEPAAGTDVTGIYLDNVNPFLAIYAAVTRQSNAGYQLHIHVNGDLGLETVLDVLERRMRENPRAGHRSVIVHFACSNEEQVARIARLGAIVSANPYYTVGFADKYAKFGLGAPRADAMVRSASVVKRHIPLSFHSDLPMGPSEPLNFVWCAVNRVTPSGRVSGPEQRIGVEDALRAVTIESAYSWRKENELGSIAPGKIANFTVLEQDPLAVEPMKLKDISIWATVFEGRIFPVSAPKSAGGSAALPGQAPQLAGHGDPGHAHAGCPCEVARMVAAALTTNR